MALAMKVISQVEAQRKILEEAVSTALELASGKSDGAEVAVSKTTGISVSTRYGEVENVEFNSDGALGITVYHQNRKGSASSTDLSPQAIARTVQAALDIARYTSPDPYAGVADKELLAFDAACKKLGGWRLWQCELFVTLEPCPMCRGAIITSRSERVVYGAADVKAGCCGSVTDLFAQPFNHHPVIEKGLRADEAQQLLQEFFVSLRVRRAAKPRWKPPVNP